MTAFDILTSWVAWPVHVTLAALVIFSLIERKL